MKIRPRAKLDRTQVQDLRRRVPTRGVGRQRGKIAPSAVGGAFSPANQQRPKTRSRSPEVQVYNRPMPQRNDPVGSFLTNAAQAIGENILADVPGTRQFDARRAEEARLARQGMPVVNAGLPPLLAGLGPMMGGRALGMSAGGAARGQKFISGRNFTLRITKDGRVIVDLPKRGAKDPRVGIDDLIDLMNNRLPPAQHFTARQFRKMIQHPGFSGQAVGAMFTNRDDMVFEDPFTGRRIDRRRNR